MDDPDIIEWQKDIDAIFNPPENQTPQPQRVRAIEFEELFLDNHDTDDYIEDFDEEFVAFTPVVGHEFFFYLYDDVICRISVTDNPEIRETVFLWTRSPEYAFPYDHDCVCSVCNIIREHHEI